MDIRFISSLTAEDENRIAPLLLSAAAALLDGVALAYTLRLETVGGRSFEHVHWADGQSEVADAPRSIAEVGDGRSR